MANEYETYLIEQNATSNEKVLLGALYKDPTDKGARNALVDLLIERGFTITAENVRAGWTPGKGWGYDKPRTGWVGSGAIASGFASIGFISGFTIQVLSGTCYSPLFVS